MHTRCSLISIFSGRYYYGDSVVDIPIMEAVGYPVAINPMEELKEFAQKKGWPIISFQ